MRLISWLIFSISFAPNIGQTQNADSVEVQSIPKVVLSHKHHHQDDSAHIHNGHFEVLPAFAFQPETGFRYGANSIFYKKLSRFDDTVTRMSKLAVSAFGTTKQQYYGFANWLAFTKNNRFAFSGFLQAGKWIDRYYNIGNSVNFPTTEYYADKEQTLNYANFQYTYLDFYMVANKLIAPHLYAGLTFERDKSQKNKYLADNIQTEQDLDLERNEATRVGIGADLVYDSRDNTDNPLTGYNIQLVTAAYRKELGSTQNYHILTLDADHYINTFKNHTWAMRFVTEYRQAEKGSVIPFRGMSYTGGITTSMRGYFQGTYRDNNMLAFESEYRMPIVLDPTAPLWKVWRRFGVVGFLGAVKVSETYGNLWKPKDFHVAGGVGLRYMVDMKQRINMTVDYAVGFDKDSGLGQRQSGFYFSLGEAF